jgi:predicted transcriptional regulator
VIYDVKKKLSKRPTSYINDSAMSTKPVPVRLDARTKQRLDAAAKTFSSTRTNVMRLCLSTFLDYYESRDGKIDMPLDWDRMMSEADGRTREARALQLNENNKVSSTKPPAPPTMPVTYRPAGRSKKREAGGSSGQKP